VVDFVDWARAATEPANNEAARTNAVVAREKLFILKTSKYSSKRGSPDRKKPRDFLKP